MLDVWVGGHDPRGQVGDGLGGKQLTCPKCAAKLVVPNPTPVARLAEEVMVARSVPKPVMVAMAGFLLPLILGFAATYLLFDLSLLASLFIGFALRRLAHFVGRVFVALRRNRCRGSAFDRAGRAGIRDSTLPQRHQQSRLRPATCG